MTTKIHLLCKQAEGLRIIDKSAFVFESEAWLLSRSEMASLKGGEALLHETKAKPSYFGGTVLEVRPILEGADESGRVRCVLTIQSKAASKGIEWDDKGQNHAMAWTSGVLGMPE